MRNYNEIWNDSVEQRKYHLVKWDLGYQPNASGGLGIRFIDKVNKALLGKGFIGEVVVESGNGLGWHILIHKYKLERVESSVSCLVEKTNFLVALWISTSKSFEGYSMEQIMLHWKELAFSYEGP